MKYHTKAAVFYRNMLNAVSDNQQYTIDPPEYQVGVQLLDEEEKKVEYP